jgi:hypothetical protein
VILIEPMSPLTEKMASCRPSASSTIWRFRDVALQRTAGELGQQTGVTD